MQAHRPILAASLILPIALLLSCQGESGSSRTGLDAAGFWGGCQRPDDSAVAAGFYDGDEHRVFVTFSSLGDPDTGSYLARVIHPDVGPPATARKGCPSREFEFAGEADGLSMSGVYNGIQRHEYWDVDIEFSEDGTTATGTYRVTTSNHTLTNVAQGGGPVCPGLTGTFELIKDQLIAPTEAPPFDACPGATADLR